jgi:hypothetical protein
MTEVEDTIPAKVEPVEACHKENEEPKCHKETCQIIPLITAVAGKFSLWSVPRMAPQ